MKKILFATTALVATAGVAAADVSLSGYGRVGIAYVEGRADEWRIDERFRLSIDASTAADNGMEFGVRVRYQQDDVSYFGHAVGFTPSDQFNQARYYMKAGGFEVGVGHIYGAIDSMPGMYAGSVGLTGLGYVNVVHNYGVDFYTSTSALSNLGNGVELTWSAGDFGIHVSRSENILGAERTALAASYSFGDWTVAAAIQDSNIIGDTEWALTAGGNIGAASVTLQVADNDGFMKYGIGGSFDVGAATSIQAYVNTDEAAIDEESYGIGFVHNLGGGASLRGGVASTNGTNRADLGVLFNF